jgi:hypothetical protein
MAGTGRAEQATASVMRRHADVSIPCLDGRVHKGLCKSLPQFSVSCPTARLCASIITEIEKLCATSNTSGGALLSVTVGTVLLCN